MYPIYSEIDMEIWKQIQIFKLSDLEVVHS